jgi:hypothetical protein
MFDFELCVDVELIAFDNEGGEGEGEGGNGDPGQQQTPTNKKEMFTPEQNEYVNSLIAREKRAMESKLTNMSRQLEALSENQKLTKEEKEAIQKAHEDLQAQFRTKEELAKERIAKTQKQAQEDLQREKEARIAIETKYRNEIITRSLTDAAVTAKAVNPAQIVALLKDKARLVEDDKPVVAIMAKSEETGNIVELLLPPLEALERMKENPADHNLFASGSVKGIGGNNGTPGPGMDVRNMTTEQYIKARRANPYAKLPGMQ